MMRLFYYLVAAPILLVLRLLFWPVKMLLRFFFRRQYFRSVDFDSMDGCAKAIVAKCREAGVVLTGAGATYPYGKDPKDSNIRLAPSFPTKEELQTAADLFVLCVKLVSVEKLLEEKQR